MKSSYYYFSFQGKMAPSSGELWGHHLMPQVHDGKRFYLKCKIKHKKETSLRLYQQKQTKSQCSQMVLVDCLLPNGVIVPLRCPRWVKFLKSKTENESPGYYEIISCMTSIRKTNILSPTQVSALLYLGCIWISVTEDLKISTRITQTIPWPMLTW